MKKIKGSLSKPEPTSLIAIAAISLCVLLPLRVYQATTLIEPDTGFYSESNITIPLFYIIGAVVIVALMLLSFLSDKSTRARNCVAKSKALGIVSGFTALSIMYSSIMSFLEFMQIHGEYSSPIHEKGMLSYLTQSGAAALMLEAVFGVISAFFFWIYTVSCFNKSAKLSSFTILSAAPTLWAICRIVFRFVEKISFVNRSDLLLELIMLVFLIMFMLAFAQVVTGSSPEISAWRLFGCGLPAAIVAFLISVPRIFLFLIGHSDLIVEGYGFDICDFALAIFIPVFLYSTSTAKKHE
ncbi:MAG: hypothetical protein IJ261_01820 [Clostridia bacterium]|nr:hypothetical protein [Clostridia bacterium]